ncbi:MAG TPA: hypothetical protein VMW57_00920 [Methyloceanibacter sp.]|nr:hypothetical protein [Methyloceanibacter sp.]
MNRHKNLIMIALAALVASAAALVYAQGAEQAATPQPKAAVAQAEAPNEAQAPKDAQAPKVLYDLAALPDPVQRTLTEIIFTAETGDIEAMRPVLESREIRPMVAAEFVSDPIAYWKKHSADGTGRDVLAVILNMLASGFVLSGEGRDATYVWPYFAEVDITKLTPAQEVEFYRAVPPHLAASMKKTGKYSYYRLGISPAGVWHYFIQ